MNVIRQADICTIKRAVMSDKWSDDIMISLCDILIRHYLLTYIMYIFEIITAFEIMYLFHILRI